VFDISGWEFLTLAVLAMILFGPDKLPKLAADAGKFIRMMRSHLQNARTDLSRELGPEITNLNLSDMTPRGMIRKALGDVPIEDLRNELNLREEIQSWHTQLDEPSPQSPHALAVNEVPPYDTETT
jgi:sec-independent protein translocase protein TatB